MAEKKKSTAKAKKSEPKSKKVKGTLEAAAEAKALQVSPDTSDSGSVDSGPEDYSLGEGQKTVTNSYRKGWDAIFSTKR